MVVPSGFTPPTIELVAVPKYAVVWNDPFGKLIPLPVSPRFIPVVPMFITITGPVDPTGIKFMDS